jgi:hypothetical protein
VRGVVCTLAVCLLAISMQAQVTPIIECRTESAGTLSVVFGYDNAGAATATIPHGANNFVSPPPAAHDQPTTFDPGVHHNAFIATFALADENAIAWTVDGNTVDLNRGTDVECTSCFCAPGPAGPLGPQGETGAAGATGADGAQGATGDVGPIGPQGPQGPTGLAGSTGATGAVGLQGFPGETGAAGPTGPTGASGVEGPVGLAGERGEAGAAGPDGIAGEAGASGEPGMPGPLGDAGSPGADGELTFLATMAQDEITLDQAARVIVTGAVVARGKGALTLMIGGMRVALPSPRDAWSTIPVLASVVVPRGTHAIDVDADDGVEIEHISISAAAVPAEAKRRRSLSR